MLPANQTAFLIPDNVRVSRIIATTLRQQIQYYMSKVNLLTDRFLRNVIFASAGGWVQITIFLQFNKVTHIFEHMLSQYRLTGPQKVMIIKLACLQSQQLYIGDGILRRREKCNEMLRFDDVFYIEGPQSQIHLLKELGEVGMKQGLTVRSCPSNDWHILHLFNLEINDINSLCQVLKERALQNNWRIVDGRQFIELEKEYNTLGGIRPLDKPIEYSEDNYKFPQGQVIPFEDINSFKVKGHKKNMRVKSRLEKSRLPKKYLHEREKGKPLQEHFKFEVQFNQSNRKRAVRTAEEEKQYRKKKMIQRIQRKHGHKRNGKPAPANEEKGDMEVEADLRKMSMEEG